MVRVYADFTAKGQSGEKIVRVNLNVKSNGWSDNEPPK